MMKVLFVFVCAFVTLTASAQKKTKSKVQPAPTAIVQQQEQPQEQKPVAVIPARRESKSYMYCELFGETKQGTFKASKEMNAVKVNFGRKKATSGGKGNTSANFGDIIDENGKKINFYSMVDAMNYMGTQGWEIVHVYSIFDKNQQRTTYILKKEISPEEKQQMKEELQSEE
jgi:hypothetical protein